jgi:flavodoxin/ferredoxin
MGKALIAYFSQGGSTYKVAEQIAAGMKDKHYAVALHDIRKGIPSDISEYDVIGIGSPVYIFRVPFNVMKFIKDLPDLTGKSFFVFLSYGSIRGAAGNPPRRALERKGGREAGYSHYKGSDFFIGYIKRGYLFSPDNPTSEELGSARDFGGEIAARLSGKAYVKPPMEPQPSMVFTLQRLMSTKSQVKWIYTYSFKADERLCDSCGVCTKVCPQGNITLDEGGHPRWGKNCIACFYCELKCPEGAIRSFNDWLITLPFIKYNLGHSMGDVSIGRAMVKLNRGKVERI